MTTSQFNTRLPSITHDQIEQLAETHGLTKTQVIILAIDRLARDLNTGSYNRTADFQEILEVLLKQAPTE